MILSVPTLLNSGDPAVLGFSLLCFGSWHPPEHKCLKRTSLISLQTFQKLQSPRWTLWGPQCKGPGLLLSTSVCRSEGDSRLTQLKVSLVGDGGLRDPKLTATKTAGRSMFCRKMSCFQERASPARAELREFLPTLHVPCVPKMTQNTSHLLLVWRLNSVPELCLKIIGCLHNSQISYSWRLLCAQEPCSGG